MKILQFISTLGFYGAENVLLELSKGLRYLNHDIFIGALINNEIGSRDLIKAGSDNGFESVPFCSEGKLNVHNILLLRDFLISHQIEIIHSHNYKSNFYALIASIGLPILCFSTCHNWPGKSFRMQAYKVLDMLQLRTFNKVIAVSDAVEKQLHTWGIPKNKVIIVHNGIDVKRFSPQRNVHSLREQLGIMKGEIVVGTVSRLTEEKGHINIIKAAKKILVKQPYTKFLIVGDGPLMNDIKKEASGLPFIFSGARNDVEVYYHAMDIFILPSLNEGLPMALLEAMCSGLPVVASNVGDIDKVIIDPKMGILIDPGGSDQLADQLIGLLENEEMREKIGLAATQRILNNFSSKMMAEKYDFLYCEAKNMKYRSQRA